jgi:hypothetical protein
MRPNPQDPGTTRHSAEQEVEIRATLDRVLASPAFRKSEQCRRFLSYVVEHSHKGEDELLKERIIGVEVFGREADYDTAEDPVVRVRATEVRKRLAQYYGESAAESEVRIEIPSGSYRVEFHWPAVPPTHAELPGKLRPRRVSRVAVGLGLLALLALAVGAAVMLRSAPPDAVQQFWAPVLDSPKPVLIYCGQPVVYFLSREVHDKYRNTVPPDKQRGSYALTLDPKESIRGSDVIAVTDQFVGIGNAHTAALLAGLFAAKRRAVEIRYANDLSFSDLRGSPSVLIGAFSNLWTLEMQGGLRFVFEQDKGARRIRDRSDNRTWQLADLAPDGKTPEDYALVSRLFDSATGQLLISAAGITQNGTRSAGEFLTNPSLMTQMLAKVPADWPKRNVQVLLHTNVYKGTPGSPKVVATHVW